MSAVDWDEVKRLAADFQRAQLSSTIQRLSERNCIEIVSRLIDLKLLDVVFTTDGKEYVTPQQLTREIRDELYVHGGGLKTYVSGEISTSNFWVKSGPPRHYGPDAVIQDGSCMWWEMLISKPSKGYDFNAVK